MVPLARDMPVIYVFSQVDDPGRLCLLPDDEGGAALAIEHLVGLGRRRIAHVTGPEHFEAVRLRRDGYRKTLAAAGLRGAGGLLPARRLVGGLGPRGGRPALRRPRRRRPTRSSAATTRSPAASPTRCASAASPCPDDVAIVGFDNWEMMAEATRPPLTSVDMNLSELGREAGRTADRA